MRRRVMRLWARLTGDSIGALTDNQQALYTSVLVHDSVVGVGVDVLLPKLATQLDATRSDRVAVARALGIKL
ncbi:hypothetical protein [Micromonospora sp. WMMD737]|uniref:hypothetical protein n=1 Tax=Micromonospora sp. WMMD737 TaxID=3404113 RepID=UPI003B95439D